MNESPSVQKTTCQNLIAHDKILLVEYRTDSLVKRKFVVSTGQSQ